MRTFFALAVACGFVLPAAAVADTYSYFYFSLEWLVDASDSIVEVTVVPSPYTGNPAASTVRVKGVARVIKQVGDAGPKEGAVLPCHVAGGDGHRVLLFTRPAPNQPGKRVAYCVFLAAPPADRQGDPFARLPFHTSSFLPVPFRDPTCVAIDQAGRVLTDPVAVVRLVEARVKAAPERVSADGRNVKVGPKVDDGDDHNLLVPVESKGKE